MDFKRFLINFLTSFLIVLKRYIRLISDPYITMRRISMERDSYQLFIIAGLIFIYFKFIYFLRDRAYPATFIYFIFVLDFLMMVGFFYLMSKFIGSRKSKKEISFASFIFTFSYSLLPTLIWFLSTSILYVFLPPPRTFSLLGKGFSIFFITYSLSLLVWKLILIYLALRFSSKQNFFRIIYMVIFFLTWFIPYSVFLYQFKLFRIPFI